MVQALNSKVDEKIQDSDLKEVIKYVWYFAYLLVNKKHLFR